MFQFNSHPGDAGLVGTQVCVRPPLSVLSGALAPICSSVGHTDKVKSSSVKRSAPAEQHILEGDDK